MLRASHLLAIVVAVGAAAALGGCASDSASTDHDFGGGGADMGSPPADGGHQSDLGFISDASSPRLAIELQEPTPLESAVATTTTLRFRVLPAGASQTQIEQWLQVLKRGTTMPLSGAFAWSAGTMPGEQSLLFLPSTQLTDQTDYVVHVDDPRAFPSAVLRTGFRTGSHPRVIEVNVTPSAVGFAFSEDMTPATVQFASTVLLDLVTVPGGVNMGADARHYLYQFSTSHAGQTGTLTLHVAVNAQSAKAGNAALDPESWDSMTTAADGAFAIDFPNVNFTALPSWTPTVY
jgi:hypothetical protein